MTGPKNALAINRNKPILERLTGVEEFLGKLVEDRTQLVDSIQQTVDRLQYINSKSAEVIEAVISALGDDFKPKFESAIVANKLAREERIANLQKAQLQDMVANNKMAKVNTVSDRSLVVGRELKPDGTVVHPGYQQIEFKELDPKIQTDILDKAVGTVIDTLTDNKFEILEIYETVVTVASVNPTSEAVLNA